MTSSPHFLPPTNPLPRPTIPYLPLPLHNDPFTLFSTDKNTRNYKTQYANIYYTRLLRLRTVVGKAAAERWAGTRGSPKLLKRILNVQRTTLCYIIGTIYMEMPLKPNILEDMGRDHWIAAPPPRRKIFSPDDTLYLEDESGRVTLTGHRIHQEINRPGGGLVTGVVMACLGMETAEGDFEVVDVCFAGLPPLATTSTSKGRQGEDVTSVPVVLPLKTGGKGNVGQGNNKGKGKQSDVDVDVDVDADVKMDIDIDTSAPLVPPRPTSTPDGRWVALISGLSAGSSQVPEDLKGQLLVEWLMGELGGVEDQMSGAKVGRIILAGNSLAQPVRNEDDRKPKRYGYDASTYTAHPTSTLDAFITDLLSTGLPVHVIPGAQDPVGSTLPQQPFPRSMLRNAAMGGGKALSMQTNPCWFELGGRSFLGAGGQALDDIYKYLPSDDRLSMARRTLEWRHVAPTAPDTLWCFPFSDKDPFIIERRPDVYFLGNQPEFRTTLVGDPSAPTRIVLLPRFADTGIVTLINIDSPTLECKTVTIGIPEWDEATKLGKVELTEEEVEAERARTAVVRSDLDMMNDEGGEW